MSHKYLSGLPNGKALLSEYLYHLLTPLQNLNKTLKEFLTKKTNKEKVNKITKNDFIQYLTLSDLDYIFNEFINYKFKNKKFDSNIVPSIITKDKFKNRAPYEIEQEKNENSYNLIKNILKDGFPIVTGTTLYVFYIRHTHLNLRDIFNSYYQHNNNLNLYDEISTLYEELIYERIQQPLVEKIYFINERDYFNSLLFLYRLTCVLSELNYGRCSIKSIIVWKKAEMKGSLFEISNIERIIKLFGNEPKQSNIIKFLAYLFLLRRKLEKTEVIDSLLDKFSYHLLFKNLLDAFVINQILSFTVNLWRSNIELKNLNKKFIIEFIEELYGENMDEYFQLGQEIRSKIYSICEGNFELFEKIIDRFAKDLRNEELPEYFIETFTKDIVWLESKGLKLSKELTEKFEKLITQLKTSDLGKFYFIKSAIILGLLSPIKKEDSKEENNKGEIV